MRNSEKFWQLHARNTTSFYSLIARFYGVNAVALACAGAHMSILLRLLKLPMPPKSAVSLGCHSLSPLSSGFIFFTSNVLILFFFSDLLQKFWNVKNFKGFNNLHCRLALSSGQPCSLALFINCLVFGPKSPSLFNPKKFYGLNHVSLIEKLGDRELFNFLKEIEPENKEEKCCWRRTVPSIFSLI